MYKLFVLDKNTWNNTTVCKLFVLDRNTWYHDEQKTHQKFNKKKKKKKKKKLYIYIYIYIFVNWITVTRKSSEHLRKHWTAVSTLLGLISSVYCDLHHCSSNQQPQIAEPKLYNWANISYTTDVKLQLSSVSVCRA